MHDFSAGNGISANAPKDIFQGCGKPEMIKSIKPSFGHIGIAWFEELDQFHGAESVRKIEQSVFRGGDVAYNFKTYNPPPTASNWANKYTLIPKENQLQHDSNYLSVPIEWLGKTFIDEAEHLKTVNPLAYEHEYMGAITAQAEWCLKTLKSGRIPIKRLSALIESLTALTGILPRSVLLRKMLLRRCANDLVYLWGVARVKI
jgi:hypothetical protein